MQMAKLLFSRCCYANSWNKIRSLSNTVESGPHTSLYTHKSKTDTTDYRIPLLQDDEETLFWATIADQWRLGPRKNARPLNTSAKALGVTPEMNIRSIKYLNHECYDLKKLNEVRAFSEFSDYIPSHETDNIKFRRQAHVNMLTQIWRQGSTGQKGTNMDTLTGSGFSHTVDIGKSFGPPQKLSKDGSLATEYDTRFNSKILQIDYRNRWFSKAKQPGFRVTVAVGNCKGLLGVGMTFHPRIHDGLVEAKKFAYQQLVHFPMFENGSIPYATRGRYHRTELHVIPGPPYQENKAHRVAKILLDLAGYKHVGVKLFGRNLPESICKAFFVTFQNFETYQEQADDLGRYVVKFDPQTYFKPTLLAAPKDDSNPVPYNAEIHASSQQLYKKQKD